MNKISGLEIPVCLLVMACAVGCGSPKTQFEAFISKADTAFRADKILQADHVFDPLRYDIKKRNQRSHRISQRFLFPGFTFPPMPEKRSDYSTMRAWPQQRSKANCMSMKPQPSRL
jgi:hypothetical protein